MRKSYTSYKDNGIKWIGKIPDTWNSGKMKYKLLKNDGGTWGRDTKINEVGTIIIRSTEIEIDGNWDLSNPIKRSLNEDEIKKCLLYEGDIVITKSSGSSDHIGKSVVVSKEIEKLACCFSNFVQRIRFRNFHPRLYHYILNSYVVREQYRYLTQTTTGLGNLNSSTLDEVQLPFIPLSEQKQILRYLDYKTQLIDKLIEKTKKKIELLKEKRITLINHCVTKGLNPNVEMKDSGIEWIGDIPKHWKVLKYKYLTNIITGNTPSKVNEKIYYTDSNGDYVWVKPTSLNNGFSYINESEEYLTEEGKNQTRLVPKDSTMICCIGNSMGKLGISGKELSTNQQINTVIPNQKKVDPFFCLFYSSVFTRDLLKYANFVTLPIYTKSDLENTPFILPPIHEQNEIVKAIKNFDNMTNKIITKEKKRIELLQEYRKSLISEVVTGKIDVRDEVIA